MKIDQFTLTKHDVKDQPVIPVAVPEGSKFISAQVMTAGISLFYECPSNLVGVGMRVDEYSIIRMGQEIPANAEFVVMLSTLVEVPVIIKNKVTKNKEQGVMIFTIYKIKSSKLFTLD